MSQQQRIAVVDDDRAYVEMVCDVLEEEGFATISFRSSIEARQALTASPPDLVILDLWIEHPLAGRTLVEALRVDPATSATPLVVCSGDTAQLHRYLDSSAVPLCAPLAKPFELTELIETVHRMIAAPRSAGAPHTSN
jgi:DNA-binding NtrC family response regulator